MKPVSKLILALVLGSATPVGAVVVIAPAKPVMQIAPAPGYVDQVANDPATWLILGLGLAVVLLVARTTRQPRTVTV